MLTKQIKCQHLGLQILNHKPHTYFQYLQFLKCLKVELNYIYRHIVDISNKEICIQIASPLDKLINLEFDINARENKSGNH